MNVAVTLSSRDDDAILFDRRLTRGSLTISGRDGTAPPRTLCVDGENLRFASGTTRVFHLNDTHRDAPGDAP
jgi:hypothetical protein